MFHRDVDIPLAVKAVWPETPGYLSIIFGRPQGFEYDAGDWIDLAFPGRSLEGGTIYSLASSPTEPDLMITLREGIMPFKRELSASQPGDVLTVRQYGSIYGFRLRANRSSTLIAGGVGIAPFRGMLKEMADEGGRNDVQLIFLNKTEDFLFRDEIDRWSSTMPGVTVNYIMTRDLHRKDRHKRLTENVSDAGQLFYAAGPSGLVSDTLAFLTGIGVGRERIMTDDFGSY